MAIRINFFNTPEHKVFHYEPMYYDEYKEHVEELRKKYGKDKTEDEIKEMAAKDGYVEKKSTYVPGMSIRGSFRKGLEENRKQEANGKLKTVIRLISLLAAAVVAYYIAQGLASMLMN